MFYLPAPKRIHLLSAPSKTREQWLSECTELFRPWFVAASNQLHTPILPGNVRVSCGWPSERALSRSAMVIGQCFVRQCSKAEINEVFISPFLSDPVQVSATLLHELIHAADNCQNGHSKKVFGELARHFGLDGELTSTFAGKELTERLNTLTAIIGPYPHAALDAAELGVGPIDPKQFKCPKPGRIKKQSTRLIKLECPKCGYTVRTTSKWIEKGLPTCVCGGKFGE